MVQLLLDKGATVDIANADGNTALYHAELYNNEAVVQLLRSAGARCWVGTHTEVRSSLGEPHECS